eukprot:186290-Rhodomonas_salina.2
MSGTTDVVVRCTVSRSPCAYASTAGGTTAALRRGTDVLYGGTVQDAIRSSALVLLDDLVPLFPAVAAQKSTQILPLYIHMLRSVVPLR